MTLSTSFNFVSDYTILQDVFPNNATKRKILSLAIRCVNNGCPYTGDLGSKEVKTQLKKKNPVRYSSCHARLLKSETLSFASLAEPTPFQPHIRLTN